MSDSWCSSVPLVACSVYMGNGWISCACDATDVCLEPAVADVLKPGDVTSKQGTNTCGTRPFNSFCYMC